MLFKDLRPKMLLCGASKHMPYNYLYKHMPYNYLFYIKGVEGPSDSNIVTFDKYLYHEDDKTFLVEFDMRRNESQWKNPKMIFNGSELAVEEDLRLFVKGIFNSKDIRILKR